jgi:hypothetical protein
LSSRLRFGATELQSPSVLQHVRGRYQMRPKNPGEEFEGFDTFDWMRPGAAVADKQILLLFPLRMQERDAGIAASESQVPLLWEAVLEYAYAE